MRGAARLFGGALLIAGLAGLEGSACADDSAMIHIRARSQLRIREGERGRARDGFRLGVLVQLSDNLPAHAPTAGAGAAPSALGELPDPGDEAARSFSGQRIRLRLETSNGDSDGEVESRLLFTDASGAASFRFSGLPSGSYRITASYDGDSERDRSESTLDVDLDRKPAQLDLDAPETLDRHGPVPVQLRLRSAGEPAHGQVELGLKQGGKDLFKRLLAVPDGGRSESLLLAASPPPSGSVVTLTARFAGDDETAPVEMHRELLLTSQANITLEIAGPRPPPSGAGSSEAPEVAQGSSLVLTGTAFDDLGPLRDETVDLEATAASDRRRLGSVLTDGYGRYRLQVEKVSLRVGSAFLSAQVTPRRGHILTGRSAELPITVLPPEPVSLLPFLIPLLLTLVGAVVALLGRLLRPRLQSWLASLRQRRQPENAEAAESPSGPHAQPPLPTTGEAGVSLGKGGPRTGLTLRRTVDSTIDGVVHDAVFGPVIAGAVLQLVAPAGGGAAGGEASEASTGADGRFAFTQVKPGRYQVRVTAPGFLPTEFAASVPHRGELRGVTVRLMPVRARLHSEWQRVAAAFCGEATKLATRTPQEVLSELAARREQPGALAAAEPQPSTGAITKPLAAAELQKLRRLTALVEQGYYSQRLCTEEMLREAERLALALTQPDGVPLPPELPQIPSGPVRADIRAPGAPRPLV